MKSWKVALQAWLLRHVFCANTVEDVLHVEWVNKEQGIASLYIGSQKLPQGEAFNFVKETQLLQDLPALLKIRASLQGAANEMLFTKAKNVDDMVFSKAILYTIDVEKQLIDSLARIQEIR